ncbi:hypothetical protein KSP40_PGU003268 [Platanthera guangdongensis]|uniref:Uncharacterized protein n=1 Tax=Platanthera guangdongensis TaxID=2320717 RepID=A0ABR2M5P0_9ASPA
MASATAKLLRLLLFLLLLSHCAVAEHHSLAFSPAAAPSPGGRTPSPLKAISGSLSSSSPLADLSPDLQPSYPISHQTPLHPSAFLYPAPSPAEPASSSVPTPSLDLIQPEDDSSIQSSKSENESQSDSGSGGMSGWKKAVAIIAAVAASVLVGMGFLVCKKRQENIRRSRYGYATRNGLL